MKSPGLPPGMDLNHLFDNPHANAAAVAKKVASPFSSVTTLSCRFPRKSRRFYCRNSLPDEWFSPSSPFDMTTTQPGYSSVPLRLKAMQFGWSKITSVHRGRNADGRELTHQAVRLLAYLSDRFARHRRYLRNVHHRGQDRTPKECHFPQQN